MVSIRKTAAYNTWFRSLRDQQAKARINIRVRRLSLGNPGDVKPVGEGVSELRVDYGPGYRIYFTKKGNEYVVLLTGGDKSTQASDIREAKSVAGKL